MSTRSSDLVAIGVFWIISALLVGVHGNFPLFDDWVYARQVQELVTAQHLYAPVSSENFLLPQIVWAALFSLPTGFSFEALRVSTLVTAVAGTAAMYLLLSELGVSRRIALFGAFLVGANPLFVSLAFTFMSDVPTIALCVAALCAFARSERLHATGWFWVAIALATVATVNRLTAATVVAAVGFGHVAASPSRARLLRGVVAIAGPFVILRGIEAVVARTIGMPGQYRRSRKPCLRTAPAHRQSRRRRGDRVERHALGSRPRVVCVSPVRAHETALVNANADRPVQPECRDCRTRQTATAHGQHPLRARAWSRDGAGIEGNGPRWAWWHSPRLPSSVRRRWPR